ncbi:unnamed protein product [Prunus armeniaca]|uniref:Sialate O-acetylesterase domain-containing protein n=1 Tax=Prunus armeniaca TaxID=36596 RepID=A0A6J5TRF6_PRUAR|nr:unnamed protein product [Prunus armeniaca]
MFLNAAKVSLNSVAMTLGGIILARHYLSIDLDLAQASEKKGLFDVESKAFCFQKWEELPTFERKRERERERESPHHTTLSPRCCFSPCSSSPLWPKPARHLNQLPTHTNHNNKKQSEARKTYSFWPGRATWRDGGGVVNDTVTGIATWDGVVPPECLPNPSILRLSADLKWVEAREPLHADIDAKKTNGIGPGMAFAKAILVANRSGASGEIGLVPCAVGGTNITQWTRGSFLYNQMIRRAKAALNNGGTIRALLWYQGESDTANRKDAKSYKNRVETFFGDVRLDLQSPALPIIQVALASGEEAAFVETVREAQLGVDFLNVRTVDAKGLPLETDGLHLTTPAQVRLGQMLAAAYLQFLPSSSTAGTSDAPRTLCNFVSNLGKGQTNAL